MSAQRETPRDASSPHHDVDQQTDEARALSEHTTTEERPEADARITFADLGVLPTICEALAAVGIEHPFPIQSMAIPIALIGTDMIGQARTGTGKTLAFGITLLQRIVVPGERDYAELAKPGAPQALVVTPTRELASQVSKDLRVAATRRQARVLTVYGGVAYEPQLDALAAGVEVVVGTPGRLLDLMDRGKLDLTHVKVAVLDEADEMLDLGFLPDVERLLARTPELRQTMLFSATMPSAIVGLARKHLRHPVNIRAEHDGEEQTVPATAQFVYQAHDLDKPEVVAKILQAEGRDKTMIFCRTKRAAQRLADDLADRGFAVSPIHGDLTQVAREKALKRFRESGGIDVLVATDVAARGIDVTGVTHVINYECPDDDKTYVHRIGRTGRAGASGIAITFVDWADLTRWKVINNTLGLPFEMPQETYSTSEHLFHDFGIPRDSQGRVGDAVGRAPAKPAPREPRPGDRDRGGDRGGRSGGGRGRSGGGRTDDRSRSGDSAGRTGSAGGGTASQPQATESTAPADRPKRSRNRRRLRNGQPVSPAESS